MVEFGVLGPLEVIDGGRRVPVGSAKERALLALLCVEPNRVVSTDRLIEDLWEGNPPEAASVSLRVLVSRVRKALATVGAADLLITRPPGYLLTVGADALDSTRFETLATRGRAELAAGHASAAAATLRDALGLWRGPALADAAEAPLGRAEATRLEESRLVTLAERIEADLACGHHTMVVGELEALCQTHPLQERLWAQRMIALYRSGRQADALDVYSELRHILAEELGLDPSPELAALETAILNHDPALAAPASLGATPMAPVPAAGLPSGVITFLLTDIEGSTALWDTNPHAMAPALERHDQLIASVIAAAGGHLVKSKGEGDAILAVFRRASDAVAGALELQTAITAEQWADGIDLRVRVAIHTGEAHERDGDYFGPTVNRAARLRSLANGGQVLLSRATAELVRDRLPDGVTLTDLGTRELRGLSRDERVFELVEGGAAPAVTPIDVGAVPLDLPLPGALTGRQTDFFVARQVELDALAADWKNVAAGGRSVALVAGEPGIGKTRLVAEAAIRAHGEGAVVLAGRCDEDMGAPYQPFVDALADFVRDCPAEWLTPLLGDLGGELTRLVPEIAARCPALAPPMRADPETERHRLFEAVNGWLTAVGGQTPVVLVLDDLHWAAKPTLGLLRHLARSSSGGLLVLGTYRHTDLDRAHPLAEVLADLRRDAGVRRVALRGLDNEETVAFVEASGGQALNKREVDFAHTLHDQTEGNPFFLGEILRHLIDTGAVRRDQGRWVTTVDSSADAGLPEGVREVIGRRLSALSSAANRVLEVAAVIGPTFSSGLLDLVEEARTDDVALLDSLDEAVRAGIVRDDAGSYTFAHALIRQTVYSELTSARRTRLHRRVGEAIETFTDPDRHVEALAHHFAEAALDGQVDKAADYGLAAGRRAMVGVAQEAAVTYLDRALAALELDSRPQPGRRSALLYALATARWALGDRDGAQQSAFAAAELARGLEDPTLFVRIAIVLTALGHLLSGDPRPAELCQEALERVGATQPRVRSRLLSALARYRAFSLGQGPQSEAPAVEALELARLDGDPIVVAAALNARLISLAHTGETHAQLALAEELVGLAQELDDVRSLTDGHHARCLAHLTLGDVISARNDADALSRLAAERRAWLTAALAASTQSGFALLAGDFDRCEELLSDALKSSRDDVDMHTAVSAGRVALAWHRGEDILSGPGVDETISVIPLLGSHFQAGRAHEHAVNGRREDAQRLLDTLAVPGVAPYSEDLVQPVVQTMLAETAAILGDTAAAAEITKRLLPHSGALVLVARVSSCPGSADRFLGMLAATQRKWAEAETYYRAALELEARVDSPVLLAHTHLWYGRMLVERDDPGDHDRSIELLTAALVTATQLGMAFVSREALRLLRPHFPMALRARAGAAFVGRADELVRLKERWADAQAGSSRLVFVAGEPGIGKTSLAGEIAAHAYAQGATVLYGRCDEDAGAAYQPFAEALRAYVAVSPPDELAAHVTRFGADVARLVPELARRLPELPASPPADPESERLRLFDAITGTLAAASMRAPVVLVLDDLHWATKPTLLLLRHLMRASEPTRILVIGTYRDTDLDRSHPLGDALASLHRESVNVDRLALRGLGASEVAAYVEAVGGQSLGDDELTLAHALHAETEGNPFFVTEVLRHLVETGAAYRDGHRWVLKSGRIDDLGLPQGVRDVITQRLSRLSDNANRALAVASVIGPTFSLRVLERVPDALTSGDELLDGLDEALRAGIVVEAGGDGYEFAHALIRQTLYGELSSARRTRMHRRVGEAIECLPDADRHIDALAYHFAEAAIDGQALKAASYALSAAGSAMGRLAFEAAVTSLERGITALDLDADHDPALKADLLLAVANARHASGFSGSRDAALAAADLARALGSPERLGQAAVLLARNATLGLADPQAAAVCQDALAALPDAELALRAQVMAEFARYQAYAQGQRDAAEALTAEAIALVRQSGDPVALAVVLSSATFSWFGSGRPDEIVRLGDELVVLCEETGDTRGRYDGLVARAVGKRQSGEMDGFRIDLALIDQLAQQNRSWFGLAVAASLKASQALLEGRFGDVTQLIEEMAALGGDDPNIYNLRTGTIMALTMEQGASEDIVAVVEALLAARPGIVGLATILARCQAQSGQDEPSRRHLERLVGNNCAIVPRDASWPLALAYLAETVGYLGEPAVARDLLQKLVPYSGQLIVTGRAICYGAADRGIAILATVLEQWDFADAHFEQAEIFEEHLGAAPYVARTRTWHARMLLARNSTGDTQRAVALLDAALRTADELGMVSLASEARQLRSQS